MKRDTNNMTDTKEILINFYKDWIKLTKIFKLHFRIYETRQIKFATSVGLSTSIPSQWFQFTSLQTTGTIF